MTFLVDSHCHLDFPGLTEDVDGVLDRARAAGVGRFLTIGTKSAGWAGLQALASTRPDVFCSVGVHPHEAEPEAGVDAAHLIAAAEHPRVVAIGECGLDYYYAHSPRAEQQASFRAHIEAARTTGLPLIVHMRDAEEDAATILREEMRRGPFSGVIHCFTSTAAFAAFALDLGFHISFSGILTFKSARDLQETARTLPLDRILVETDAPYLAPVPMRGKSCEPAFVAHTARFLAALRGESDTTVATATSANFFRLFSRAA